MSTFIKDINISDAFRFTDQWYSQFIFIKISDQKIVNWDTDTECDINNNMIISVVNLEEFNKGDPARIKRYVEKTLATTQDHGTIRS